MNEQPDHAEETDEDILTYTVSDEAIEAAAGTDSWVGSRSLVSWVQGETGCLPC
jgi:hypothetical protein